MYSGSRNADWKLADKGQIIAEFKTPGINPYFIDKKHILQLLHKRTELINNAEKIKKIYFFGAGVSLNERKEIISDALSQFFKFSKIYVDNDLQAAAIATCNQMPGITGIIGSGSNAGYFDGRKVKSNNFGLGYILGDEGSANWLGRQILKHFLYEKLPLQFEQNFLKKYDTNRKEILDKIYKQTQPALYLSSFADFLLENNKEPYVKDLIFDGFNLFIETYLYPLKKQYPEVPIYIVGTVVYNFNSWFLESAKNHDLTITGIVKEPIYNLLKHYLNRASQA